MRYKILILFIAFVPAIFACGENVKQKKTSKPPKNIILMIGDGMGTAYGPLPVFRFCENQPGR